MADSPERRVPDAMASHYFQRTVHSRSPGSAKGKSEKEREARACTLHCPLVPGHILAQACSTWHRAGSASPARGEESPVQSASWQDSRNGLFNCAPTTWVSKRAHANWSQFSSKDRLSLATLGAEVRLTLGCPWPQLASARPLGEATHWVCH